MPLYKAEWNGKIVAHNVNKCRIRSVKTRYEGHHMSERDGGTSGAELSDAFCWLSSCSSVGVASLVLQC